MKQSAKEVRAPFGELTDNVEDLLNRIANVDSPDVIKIRSKVQLALSAAKSAWHDTANYASRRVTETLRLPGDYVRNSPWRILGVATLLGIVVGALLTRPRGNS